MTAAESKQTTVPDHQYGSSLLKDMPGVSLGDTVHVVVAVYSTGDTFGRDGGQTTVLDAFTDVDKANALRARAADVDDFTFTHDGKEYRADWTGYFEHLDSVEVWGVEVKGFHDYNRWG